MHLSPPVAEAAVDYKVVVLLMLIHVYCFMYPHCLWGFCVGLFLVWITLCPSSFAIILTRLRELVALLLLSCECLVTVNVM